MSEKQIVAPECPHCRGKAAVAVQVRAAGEWNYVSYRCGTCEWTWTVSYPPRTFLERPDKPSAT